MPCNSDYLAPNDREVAYQRTAILYAFTLKQLGERVPKKVLKDAGDEYNSADYTVKLCALIRQMDKRTQDRVIYNARDKTARALADWWEEHDAADRARIEREEKEARKKELQTSALKKIAKVLNNDEMRAMGLFDEDDEWDDAGPSSGGEESAEKEVKEQPPELRVLNPYVPIKAVCHKCGYLNLKSAQFYKCHVAGSCPAIVVSKSKRKSSTKGQIKVKKG